MKHPMLRACALAVAFGFACAAAAQSYPSRPIRIIVPLAPGGNVDIVARTLAQQLTENLGQQVIVENRPGASSLVGTQLAAKSAPDGYTLLAMANTFAMVPSIVANPGYDPLKDLVTVGYIAGSPIVLSVNAASNVKTVKEFIAWAQRSPKPLTYSSSGLGSSGHLVAETFAHMAGIKIVKVKMESRRFIT